MSRRTRKDFDERLDVGEARFAGVTFIRDDPVDSVGSHLDAAVPLFNFRFLDDKFFCRSGTEVVGDFGFERWLVALESEQVVGLVLDDLVGDGDLASNRIDGHQRSFDLFGFG